MSQLVSTPWAYALICALVFAGATLFTYRRFVFTRTQSPVPVASVRADGPRTPRMVIVSASMAAGHDGAAAELARRAGTLGYDVDRVDFLDLLPWGTGAMIRAAYRIQLMVAPATWGWLLPLLGRREGHDWAARVPSRLARRRLREALDPEPCLVVSTYPLASQALSDLRLQGLLTSPAVTFLTDMSVHPLWVAPGIDSHLALHEVPAAQARLLGARDVHVAGPAVRPAFAPATVESRQEARDTWGLPTKARLALVVGGSWGVGDVSRTVDDLLETGVVTPVVVCGSNASLYRSVMRLPGAVALGWVEDMPSLMRACDLVVQNSGGLTSLEARQAGLPVITYRCLPGHGLTNAAALESAGWAGWARDPATLVSLLAGVAACCDTPVPEGQIPWPTLTGVPA